MKKITCLILLFCLIAQCALIPASATEPTGASSGDTSLGSISVTSGCRTINGMSPLGGTERILETAQAVFAYERTTQTVIYSYNPDLRLYPGSLSKMLTAIIAIEECELDEEVTVNTRSISQLPVGSITAKLKNGEIITMEAAVNWLLLASANDAALVIAEHVAGSEAAFVELMNAKLKDLGCNNSYFTNCHGLDDPAQYTTARDIAKIVQYATQNPTFMKIFGASGYDVPPTNKVDKKRTIETGNHLIYRLILPQFNDTRVTGGMPSYVSATTGASIAFTAEDDGMDMVFVIMGTTRTYKKNGNADYYGNFEESLKLLEYTFSGYKINRVLYEGQALNQFPVINGESEVVGQPMEALDTVLPVTAHMQNLRFEFSEAGKGLSAPIQAGDKIASVRVWYNSSCLTEAELFAMNPVRANGNTGVEILGASQDDSFVSGFFGFLGIVVLLIVLAFAAYLIYNNIRRQMVRSRRRRRRASRRRSR